MGHKHYWCKICVVEHGMPVASKRANRVGKVCPDNKMDYKGRSKLETLHDMNKIISVQDK